jgi:transposase-like protein
MSKPWSSVRQCPRCGSYDIHRHRGGRKLRRFLLRLVLVRRYSCMYCNSLYYGYLFSKRDTSRKGPTSR